MNKLCTVWVRESMIRDGNWHDSGSFLALTPNTWHTTLFIALSLFFLNLRLRIATVCSGWKNWTFTSIRPKPTISCDLVLKTFLKVLLITQLIDLCWYLRKGDASCPKNSSLPVHPLLGQNFPVLSYFPTIAVSCCFKNVFGNFTAANFHKKTRFTEVVGNYLWIHGVASVYLQEICT